MNSKLKSVGPALLILGVLAGFTALAWATAPSGQHPGPVAAGVLADKAQVNTDRIKFQTKDPADVYEFTVTYDIGGFSGWHTHPGVLIAVVKQGKIVRQVGCTTQTYQAGDSFIESDEQPSGQVSNYYANAQQDGATEAVIYATQIVPKGSPRRVDQTAAPAC
jgi:quercetin dioxygenase-like cupin family protein